MTSMKKNTIFCYSHFGEWKRMSELFESAVQNNVLCRIPFSISSSGINNVYKYRYVFRNISLSKMWGIKNLLLNFVFGLFYRQYSLSLYFFFYHSLAFTILFRRLDGTQEETSFLSCENWQCYLILALVASVLNIILDTMAKEKLHVYIYIQVSPLAVRGSQLWFPSRSSWSSAYSKVLDWDHQASMRDAPSDFRGSWTGANVFPTIANFSCQ